MRQRRLLLEVLTVLLLGMTLRPVTVCAADMQNGNRMNVVFVMDESGSMLDTDELKLRYDALDLFLGLSLESGNYMGAVLFNEGIILKRDIEHMDGGSSKNSLSSRLRNEVSRGDTNIGLALEEAVEMLQKDGNPDLPSAIILLSDGVTDLDNLKAEQDSYDKRDAALGVAAAEGYRIYSVCLNTDGTAKADELEYISGKTGGSSVEVRSVEDLKKVFQQFYGIIYSTKTIVLADMVIPEGGSETILFRIPKIGVQEANIIISTLSEDITYTLYPPNKTAYTQKELEDIRKTVKTFSILKIQNPDSGEWFLEVAGVPGDNVKIEMIYNPDLSIEGSIGGGSPVYAGTDILMTARLFNMGKPVTDDSIYQDYPIHCVMTDTVTGAENDYEMVAGLQRGEYSYFVPDYAEYDVRFYCEIDELRVESETIHVSVSNFAPTVLEDTVRIDIFVNPFSGADHTFDLGTVVEDREDEKLEYHIKESELDVSLVSIQGEELVINGQGIKEGGELYISATDSGGAGVEIHVVIRVVAIIPLLLVMLAVAGAIVLMIVAWRMYRSYNAPICGRLNIVLYTDKGDITTPKTFEGEKGKMRLHRYLSTREDIGIDLKHTYLVHGKGNGSIYLVSKKGCYSSEENGMKSKKIVLEAERTTKISNDMNFTKGIKITYIPDMHN